VVIICILLTVFWFVLFARIIMSWIGSPRSAAFRGLFEVVHDVTEPVLRPIRGLLPPLRLGMVGLDLSPIIVFIALGLLRSALGCRAGAFL
jgi:YggT family protein